MIIRINQKKDQKNLPQNTDYYSVTTRINKTRLDFNENPYGCSPKVVKALKSLRKSDIGVYPEYNELLNSLSTYTKRSTNEILVTNGSDEAIKLIFQAFLKKSREIPRNESFSNVTLLDPSFTMYEIYLSQFSICPLKISYEPDFSLNMKKLKASLSESPNIVVICNPNNPTGTLISQAQIIKLLRDYPQTLFIIDEAYIEYTDQSLMQFSSKYPNLIILRTFSKIYGLAGLRIGYIVADSSIISKIRRYSSPFNVNSIAVKLAIEAIKDQQYINWIKQKTKRNKKFLVKFFNTWNFPVDETQANFILVKFGDNCKEIYDFLYQNDILVRYKKDCPLLTEFLRISIGTKPECKKLCRYVKKYMRKANNRRRKS